jgi:hypothetical protein
MTLEFGRPKTFSDALDRVPSRNHPLYNSEDGGPYEHVAHLREFILETWISSVFRTKALKDTPLECRFNDHSEFDLVFANKTEIDNLKNSLIGS